MNKLKRAAKKSSKRTSNEDTNNVGGHKKKRKNSEASRIPSNRESASIQKVSKRINRKSSRSVCTPNNVRRIIGNPSDEFSLTPSDSGTRQDSIETEYHTASSGSEDRQIYSTSKVIHDEFDWSDEGQIVYRAVERISIHEKDAGERVKNARINGVPVVIVGHKGWAQFAKPWLIPLSLESTTDERLDLSKPHELDIQALTRNIGDEIIPFVKKHYDEHNPITGKMTACEFLEKHWSQSEKTRAKRPFYLHQWQFPLSPTARPLLCKKSTPFPNNILGNDFMKYATDDVDDNPYQYLFMGRKDTMSQLHVDLGGMLISIAPIVGEKEVILVHRADGASCLYHLEASLSKIDLQRFPMMSNARVWKTVIKPGEILLMPQGTYHQCRNIEPCLSYSRFHLDSINLAAFLQSMINNDAPEIDHDLTIWNASDALTNVIQDYVSTLRSKKEWSNAHLPEKIRKYVKDILALRNACQEIFNRFDGRMIISRCEKQEWFQMLRDIDLTLHIFRYRLERRPPLFCPKHDSSKICAQNSTLKTKELQQQVPKASESEINCSKALCVFLRKHPKLDCYQQALTVSDCVNIYQGEQVMVRMWGRCVSGVVLQIENEMKAAYLRYDDPKFDDDYQRIQQLRLPIAGEPSADIFGDVLKPGTIVNYYEGGQEYLAVVQHCKIATFYLLGLQFNGNIIMKRWFTRTDFIEKVGDVNSSSIVTTQMEGTAYSQHDKTITSQNTINDYSNQSEGFGFPLFGCDQVASSPFSKFVQDLEIINRND